MTKTTAYYEGYLEQEARLDAATPAPERKTKSRRRADMGAIKCGPGNKACGKRCIPEAQKCRKEGAGSIAAKVGGAIAFGAAAAAGGAAAANSRSGAISLPNNSGVSVVTPGAAPKHNPFVTTKTRTKTELTPLGTVAAVAGAHLAGRAAVKVANAVQENDRKRKSAKAAEPYKPGNLGGKGVSSEDTVRGAYKNMGMPSKALPHTVTKGGEIIHLRQPNGLPPGVKGGDMTQSVIGETRVSGKEKVKGAALNTARILAKSGQKLAQKVAEKAVKAGKRTMAAGAEARRTVSGMKTPKLNDF